MKLTVLPPPDLQLSFCGSKLRRFTPFTINRIDSGKLGDTCSSESLCHVNRSRFCSSGVNQDSCPKNCHRIGDAMGATWASCLMGFRYTAPTGDQSRVEPVQRRGLRLLAAV